MKFTLSWLKDHLDTDDPAEKLADKLTMIGLEVEHIDDKAKALAPYTIARVVSAVQHPNADRLRLCMVDTGETNDKGEPAHIQVVCGAPNARTGLVSVFAPPGTYIPGKNITLGIGNIRGVESRGMLCSAAELETSDDHDGIIELPDDAPIGKGYAEWAGLGDPVIEINLTPNRQDCTGVHGIARDLSAADMGKFKDPTIKPVKGEFPCPVQVTVEDAALCPGFALRLVRGVKNGPSPEWLQKRLTSIGLRPINALVDITNFMTYDRARPLHVFDAKKVHGHLTVRHAKDGETLLALDGRTYTLDPSICVIADDKGVESLAGIMGGEESGCDENTTDVLIESALWNEINIAQTGRKLGINSDARYRFERGVDPAFMVPGLELATKLVMEMCGGTPSENVVVGKAFPEDRVIDYPLSELKRLTGIDVPGVESLGYSYDAADRLTGVANTLDGTQSQDFGYDDQSRLVSMYSPSQGASYGYDANGNRITSVTGAGTSNTGYSAGSNRLVSTTGANPESYGYDAQGNLTTLGGATAYQYDAFNRMSTAGGMSYYVNPEGQRLRKAGSLGVTYFAPDASGTLLAENADGAWIDYVWLGGRLIGRAMNGQLEAIHDDQLGRPQVVTNAAQVVVWSAQNLPFTRNVTVSSSAPLNIGFPGQYYDQETGLWNNGFRDYDAALGRYVESDPLGLKGGINIYAYVGGNPLSNVDPLGLDWQLSWTIASGSVAVPGAGASANVTVGINFPSFNPSTWSLYGTVQGAGGIGGGVFAGFGEGFNVSHGDAPTTGTSSSNYAEINAGWEIAGGLNTTWDDCGKTTGVQGAAGAWAGGGWGVGGFVGKAWSATYALPSFGNW